MSHGRPAGRRQPDLPLTSDVTSTSISQLMHMIMKIERDQRRFRQIVRGKIRENLRKYITHGEMIGRKGRDLVSIPVPQLDVPHFRYGKNGSRRRRPGRRRGRPARSASGGEPRRRRRARPAAIRAAAHSGSRRLARRAGRHPGRRAGTAAHRAQGQGQHRRRRKAKYNSIRQTRPRIAAALQAHVPARPCERQIIDRRLRAATTRASCRSSDDKRYRSWNDGAEPAGQRGRHLHDGRLRLDDRRAEGDRPHRGVLDRHLARAASTTASRRGTSSTTPSPRKSTSTRSITPAKAAARGSARPTRCAPT